MLMSLAAVLLCATPQAPGPLPAPVKESEYRVLKGSQTVPLSAMLDEMAKMDVVFVGEQHDHKLGHALQLEILIGLHTRTPGTALSLEMFERDVQMVLDEYLGGVISEASFLQAARPWPNYKTDYAPLVEFCRANRRPVIAANAPRRYANLASRKSLEALRELSREAKKQIARLPVSRDIPTGYRQALDKVFGAHGDAGPSSGMPQFIRDGQYLWDATMAESVADALRRTKARPLVQMNGSMHSDSGWGIVARLRRLNPKLKIGIISIKPDPDYATSDGSKYAGTADFLILTAAGPK
jgi:uncharacterized iron-regulated protein